MFFNKLALGATAAALVTGVGMLSMPGTASAASAKSNLYSVPAVDSFCTRAQQITASTTLVSLNIVHNDLTSFGASAAAPYDGPNLGSYGNTLYNYPLANAMPLQTQELLTSREVPTSGWAFPIVISCKMKSAEGIQAMVGPTAAGAQLGCKEVNQNTVAAVFANLTATESRYLRFRQDQIDFVNDVFSAAGPSWLFPLPEPPLVARIGSDGRLKITGRAITVAQNDSSGAVTNDKKGVFYCHFPSPEYVRALVTGQVEPFLPAPPPD